MNNQDFDRLLNSIRENEPSPEAVRAAGARVRDRLEAGPSELCAGFRADFAALRARTLPEGRRMLTEDHLHSCVACRREYSGIKPAPVIVMRSRRKAGRIALWAAAAAALIVAGLTLPPVLDRTFAPSGPRGTVVTMEGTLVQVAGQGATALAVGAAIAEGQEVRTGKGSRAVLKLRDGSLVEMAERSDLSLSERWSGKTVHLERGNVMVEAAKQRRGYLEISTADCLVSVKGTIFSVSRGLKGSRVSVVEGEVKVEQMGTVQLLHRGNQAVTRNSMEPTTVASDIGWSQNSAKYLALLGDFAVIQAKLDQIPTPGLRFSSTLLDRVPENTVVLASIPNLSQSLAEATQIFENRAQESPGLKEWWDGAPAQQVRKAVDQVRAVSNYLGDEILVAAPANGPPVVLAEIRQPGLSDYLAQTGFKGPVAFENNVVAFGSLSVPPQAGFAASPFGLRILDSYRTGAGLLFSANMEQIVSKSVVATNAAVPNPATMTGVDNVRFLVAESKPNLGFLENTASMTFAGGRHGVASWLAAPGPMGTLEFVSPQASFASAFITRSPRDLLQEMFTSMGPQALQTMDQIRQNAGFSPLDDVAATLGGEVTVAVDGPLLPTPSWKIALEVNDPARLEWAIEQAASHAPGGTVAFNKQDLNGRTYYSLASLKPAFEIDYTFVDGYLLMGANRGLLSAAIDNRAAGLTLTNSDAFRAQLPLDGHQNFSALAYYNLGPMVGPVADQLKATGLMTPEQQQRVAALTANRAPSLVYIYGEPDRILVGSRTGVAGMGLNALAGLVSAKSFSVPGLLSMAPQ